LLLLGLVMSSARSRVKALESAVGVCLLVILLLIAAGIFLKQFHYNSGRLGIGATAVSRVEARSSALGVTFRLSSFIPAGFEVFSELEVYNPENLYEKINGKADQYLESGFEKLFAQRFVSKDDKGLWMEPFVYDMAAARNAFSVYSLQRRADADTFSLFQPSFGYKTGNALYFCHGKYYVELIGSAESKELANAMAATAQNIKTNLAIQDDSGIAELSLFPADGIVTDSAKLYLKDAFGFEGLADIFTAQYNIDDGIFTAFFSKRPNPEDAQAVAQSYHNFLIENGAKEKNAANKAFESKVLDSFGTTEIIFTIGPFVVGVHEAENQQSAEKLAVRLADKLHEVSKAESNG